MMPYTQGVALGWHVARRWRCKPAAAVVLALIAIRAAQLIDADPRALAMFVALGCSLTFITPTSHPVNVFVMGPGGYQPVDYLRVGLPLTVILMIVIVAVLPVVFGMT